MISQKIFTEQMKRLETSYDHKLPVGAHSIWKHELEKMGVTSDGMVLGVNDLVQAGLKFFPSVGVLAKASNRLRREKQDQEYKTQRKENAERDATDWKENAKKRGDKVAHNTLALIFDYLDEKVAPGAEFRNGMLALDKKHPGLGFGRQAEKYREEYKRTQKVLEG